MQFMRILVFLLTLTALPCLAYPFTGGKQLIWQSPAKQSRPSPYEDKSVTTFRTTFVKKAQEASLAGDHIKACAIYQNLLDTMSGKLKEISVDNWVTVYGKFYQEISKKQLFEKSTADRIKVPPLKNRYELNLQNKKAILSTIPKFKKRISYPKGSSISADLSSVIKITESPNILYGGNSNITFYEMPGLIQYYEELPLPDDSSNPQILRWGKNNIITSAKWSPSSIEYAYILNGALCLSSTERHKPLIISSIPDKATCNDLNFTWSESGTHIALTRVQDKNTFVYVRNLKTGSETKIGKGKNPVISFDGKKTAILNNGLYTVYNTDSMKPICSVNSTICCFSQDGKKIITAKNNKNEIAVMEKKLSDRQERLLTGVKISNPVVRATSLTSLCPNLYALTTSDSKIHIASSSGKYESISGVKGKIVAGAMQTPYCIISDCEVLIFE